MCVGSDFTTFSKIHITLYICSRLQYHAFFEIDISLYSYVFLDGCSSVHSFAVSSDNLIIGLQVSEYRIIELMIAYIGEIPKSWACWFFYYACRYPVSIYRKYPKILWIGNSLAEARMTMSMCKLHDIGSLIEIIP